MSRFRGNPNEYIRVEREHWQHDCELGCEDGWFYESEATADRPGAAPTAFRCPHVVDEIQRRKIERGE